MTLRRATGRLGGCAMFALAILAASANAATVRLELVREPSAPISVDLVVRRVAEPSDVVRVKAIAPGEAIIAVDNEAEWRVTAVAPGFWAPARMLLKSATRPVTIPLYPAGTVCGTVMAPQSGKMPKVLTARFRPAFDEDAEHIPTGTSTCVITHGEFSCTVPAGVVDLRLRPGNAIPTYRWEAKVEREGVTHIGTIDVRPGSSLAGRLLPEPGLRTDLVTALLTLEPAYAASAASERDRAQRAALRLTATPNDRGYFHFDAIPPGSYTLRARAAGAADAVRQVTILRRREAELVEPLILKAARVLHVNVRPSTGPDGVAWRFELTRVENDRTLEPVASGVFGAEGVWTHPGLAAGDYALMLFADQVRWGLQEFAITSAVEYVEIEVGWVVLRGRIRLGEEPLQATVWFGGESGATAVPVTSADDGEYSAVVPKPGPNGWPLLTISANDPTVKRTLTNIAPREREGELWLDLLLPDGKCDGTVQESSKPAANALVSLYSASGEKAAQTRTDAEGSFEFRGLAPGRYALQAEARDQDSNWVEFDLAKNGRQTYVLHLSKRQLLTAKILSEHGPIAGAEIDAFPLEQRYASWPRGSDAEGHVQIKLPHWSQTASLVVRAPGYATKMTGVQVSSDTVAIGMSTLAGSLLLHVQRDVIRESWLVHRGAAVLAFFVPALTGGTTTDSDGVLLLTAPRIEPGEYALCRVPDSEVPLLAAGARPPACISGTLSPNGALKLELLK